jgi:hypothetical protein
MKNLLKNWQILVSIPVQIKQNGQQKNNQDEKDQPDGNDNHEFPHDNGILL